MPSGARCDCASLLNAPPWQERTDSEVVTFSDKLRRLSMCENAEAICSNLHVGTF